MPTARHRCKRSCLASFFRQARNRGVPQGHHDVAHGVPKRGFKDNLGVEMVAYRYLKRSVSLFYDMLGKTAVKAEKTGRQGADTG